IWLALAALVLLPAWQIQANWTEMDLSGDQPAAAYARETLAGMPPDGVLLTDVDEQTFMLWHAQIVEGRRPDVVVADRRLLGFDWFREQIERRHPGLLRRLAP